MFEPIKLDMRVEICKRKNLALIRVEIAGGRCWKKWYVELVDKTIDAPRPTAAAYIR